ncbi:hypothetical protein Mal4_39390 [Maioricimonas rarisocia]|uniref:Uncharacterized protein n=1 Tax=Maioricimonas rarisocia TaxID=2528026 RepID=A0A517ZAQ9_9PLAN|nr:arrestin family protein [Maioricimonas rarisocia]QDU39593.1 hypothetical protein Mal4_39390 [Maioricimonas rarisocia]
MSEIRIQTASEALVPGETTRVPIVVSLNEPLKVRGLHAKFHGAEETSATYTSYNAATKTTQTHTAVEHVDIVKADYLLSGRERQGFFGNVADAFATLFGGGEHDILEPGEYPFEVDLQVPADARPSFAGGKCRVFYELSVVVDIPLARDLKALQSFQVGGTSAEASRPAPAPVRTRFPEDHQRGLLDSWFGPEIHGEAALQRNTFVAGDTIEGILLLETPDPLEHRGISVRLISVESTTAHGHTDEHVHQGEPMQIAGEGTIAERFSQQFRLPVTLPGPVTTRGERFSIDCFVQVEIDVPWAKDPKLRIPITLYEH